MYTDGRRRRHVCENYGIDSFGSFVYTAEEKYQKITQ